MARLTVYCNYHNQYGTCTEEDYNDSKAGTNPSGMVRVKFDKFTQAVPFNTIIVVRPDLVSIDDMDEDQVQARINEIDSDLRELHKNKSMIEVVTQELYNERERLIQARNKFHYVDNND